MTAYASKEELALLPANRISYPEHYADASESRRSAIGLVGRVRAWFKRRAVLAELSGLTDRELADIGVSRAEMGRVFDPRFLTRRG